MKESISKKQLREFGLLIGLGIPIVIGWGIPAIGGHMFRFWTLWIGIPFLFFGFSNNIVGFCIQILQYKL